MVARVHHLLRSGLRLRAAKWLLLGGVVGLICGLIGVIFHLGIDLGIHLLMQEIVGYRPPLPPGAQSFFTVDVHGHGTPRLWLIPLVLGAGGLLCGWIITRFAPEARGAGTGEVLTAFHQRGGRIRLRAAFSKIAASIATLGSGGSGGPEGPMSLIGGACASRLANAFRLSSRDRRILLMAGVAGGTAALFRAPLAGALFAAEVLYSDPDVESDVLIPSFISAIVAYCIFGLTEALLLGAHEPLIRSLFLPPEGLSFSAHDWAQLAGYLLVALAAVLGCRALVASAQYARQSFDRLRVPPWTKPGIGGLIAGLIALLILAICVSSGLTANDSRIALATLGPGYGILQLIMSGHFAGMAAVLLLLLVAGGKILTTCCTICSGGSAGFFAPALAIGGCLGGAVGLALQGLPIAPHPAACTIMGMAAFFAAIYKVPVASLLMVSELTGSYSLLLPAMWVCALAYLLAGRRKLSAAQVSNPIASPAHRGHFFTDLLANIRVSQVFDPLRRPVGTLAPESNIEEAKAMVISSHQTVYPVVDGDDILHGIFNLNDLRSYLYDEALGLVAVAQDIATTDIISVRPQDTLASALQRFTRRNLEELPVVANDGSGRFLGLLTRREVIAAYNRVVEELSSQRRAEGWDDDADDSPRPGTAHHRHQSHNDGDGSQR